MITTEIIGVDSVALHLKEIPENVRKALSTTVQESGAALMNYIKMNKLSGQVLNVRTGTLRRSVTSVFTESDKEISAVVGPGPLKYAPVHEFGGTFNKTSKLGKSFTATYPQRSFLRSSMSEMKEQILAKLNEAVAHGINNS